MKVFKSIQFGNKAGPACEKCVHFLNDPALVEQAYPGLTAMSSGFASVRDKDGFCGQHNTYLSGRDSCADFKSLVPGNGSIR